jgi:hypothetical protein
MLRFANEIETDVPVLDAECEQNQCRARQGFSKVNAERRRAAVE